MTTVLSVGHGGVENRCDARCHQARLPLCDCVCGGRYHGRGSAEVLRAVQQDVEAGVFGAAIAIIGRHTLARARSDHPDVVRFHERDVHRALTIPPEQPRLPIGAAS